MLENFLFEAEFKNKYLNIILGSFVITIVIAIINSFIGGNSLFMVALVTLTLSYPYVNYIRSMNKEELETQMSESSIFKRHEKELTVLWSIFIGVLIGFLITNSLISDYRYQEEFKDKISGEITKTNFDFKEILTNNLEVLLLTFIISFIVSSGLLFIIVWNISIISYYFTTLESLGVAMKTILLILPHGLIEIGGYIFAGIAGALLATKLDNKKKYNHKLNKQFYLDFTYLIITSFIFILIGVIIETL